MKLFKAAYASLWLAGFLGGLPKWCLDFCLHSKYRHSLPQRLGRKLPQITKGERPLIWIHAVSMGETRAIAPLARRLSALPQQPLLLISSTTETGHAEARRSIPGADAWIYMPFDFYPIITRAVNRLKPDLVILSETDLWYQFLASSHAFGAATAIVNGKLSERSCWRWKKFSFLRKPLFGLIDLFCVQDRPNAQRFEEIGVSKEKIVITGNIKLDGLVTPLEAGALDAWKKSLGITDEQILVAGSTHDSEERLILDAWFEVKKIFPYLKLVIAPRHPERFDVVYNQLKNYSCKVSRLSKVNPVCSWDVLIVDAMGILQQFYQLATVAIVGGTFVSKVGGHSLIEPCNFGVPVLFGPHTHSQLNLLEAVTTFGAGHTVEASDLGAAIRKLLQDDSLRCCMGRAGKQLVEESRGATEKTFQQLLNLIKGRQAWTQA